MLVLGTFGPYLVLQVYAAIICRGWWRAGALLPLVWMIPVGFVTVEAFQENSNLWPCMLIPGGAGSFVYLAVLVSAYRARLKRPPARGFAVMTETRNETVEGNDQEARR